MRIVIDCASLKWRQAGIGTYVFQLIRHLAQQDPSNEYACFYNSFRLVPLKAAPVFDAPCVSRTVTRVPCALLYRLWGSDLSRLMPVDWLAGKADIVHYTNHLGAFQHHGRAVVTVYDLSILRHPEWHPLGRRRVLTASRLRWSIEHAQAVLAISDFTKNEIVSLLGVDPKKIYVTALGVDEDFFNETPLAAEGNYAALGPWVADPFILSVATLEPRKNLSRLIQAYALARKKLHFPHRLVLVGMRGWLWGDIFKTVRNLGLEREVVFPGYVPRSVLPGLMRKSALFVYPSLYEGFGLPPLEAMACGTPTIVSDTSALPELVANAAVRVNPYEVKEMADALCRLLNDQQLRDSYSCKGRIRAAQFSWRENARKTLNVYKQAASVH